MRGDELARRARDRTRPALGTLLAELEEAAYAGEIGSREDAVAYARRLLGSDAADA